MIKFFLIVNRFGQTRLAQYYGERPSIEERQKLENEIIRQCVSRNEETCFCFHHDPPAMPVQITAFSIVTGKEMRGIKTFFYSDLIHIVCSFQKKNRDTVTYHGSDHSS